MNKPRHRGVSVSPKITQEGYDGAFIEASGVWLPVSPVPLSLALVEDPCELRAHRGHGDSLKAHSEGTLTD